MYTRARFRLTLFYSILFLVIFWSVTSGLYFWMQQSLGESYVTRIKQIHEQDPNQKFDTSDRNVVSLAGNLALEHLDEIIIALNAGLLFIIPLGSWYLTGKTLQPIQKNYEQQKRFVSDASHEMKTPLSIISGEMEVALKKNRDVQEYKRIIRSSKEEIDYLSKLVENLLYLAKSDYGLKRLNIHQIDITDLIYSIVSELNIKIKEKKLKVEFNPADECVVVAGQFSLLRMLFTNLMDNAIKYNHKNGTIWIKITCNKNTVIVEIKDSGIGIASEEKERIFDRFYRIDSSRHETKGFGLGLSIVKSIVDSHDGKIYVSSEIGKGSTFTVKFPKQSEYA